MVGPLASYLVVNVSLNTVTSAMRRSNRCGAHLPAVRAETSTPVLVKIAPTCPIRPRRHIADLAVEPDLAGIVATNTTKKSRDGLTSHRGRPLSHLSHLRSARGPGAASAL